MNHSAPYAHPSSKRFTAMIVALVLLVLTIGVIMPAKAETTTSVASVAFIEGDLSIITDPAGSGLNFDFGSHYLPMSEVSYPAENAENHILTIEDGRNTTGSWYVTVSLSNFSEQGGSSSVPEFSAMINLQNADVYNENAAVGTVGLSHESNIQVSSQGAPQLVMEADSNLERGRYSMEWTNENVTLNISSSEVSKIDLKAYTATVSWSLTLGPR